MNEAIPILALCLSVAGLALSVMNYLRDRPKVVAWCNKVSFENLVDSPTSALRIRVANLGRRPLVLLNLKMKAKGQKWSFPLKEFSFEDGRVIDLVEDGQAVSEALQKHRLAQNSAVRLAEGEVMDFIYFPKDYTKFLNVNAHEGAPQAHRLWIEDCVGKCSAVKGGLDGLQFLRKAWIALDNKREISPPMQH